MRLFILCGKPLGKDGVTYSNVDSYLKVLGDAEFEELSNVTFGGKFDVKKGNAFERYVFEPVLCEGDVTEFAEKCVCAIDRILSDCKKLSFSGREVKNT